MAPRCRRVGAVHSIISGPDGPKVGLPLYPRKRTQSRTSRHVRFVPQADQLIFTPETRLRMRYRTAKPFSRAGPFANLVEGSNVSCRGRFALKSSNCSARRYQHLGGVGLRPD